MPGAVQVLTELADLAADANRVHSSMEGGATPEVVAAALQERAERLNEQEALIAKFHEMANAPHEKAAAAARRALTWWA
jgi:hypothetical protein